jgi:diguanylate cyclase (GGDEF)-like protein
MQRLIFWFDTWLRRRTGPAILTIGLAAIGLIGWIDYLTGYDLSFSIFYVAPIALVAWYGSRSDSILIALVSAVIWFFVDISSGHPYLHLFAPVWNAAVRLGYFSIIGWLLVLLQQRIRTEAQLARTDPLTGILNSRAFSEEAGRYLLLAGRQQTPFTLVYLDLDNFKLVNDTRGHAEGDRVLRAVADTLLVSTRRADLVARLGGDEFALYLPATDLSGARLFAPKILGLLRAAFEAGAWPVTVSLGAVAFAVPPSGLDQAIHLADVTMYRVKNSGKNNIQVTAWPPAPEEVSG